MNVLSRRSVVRSGSLLFALPFAGAVLPAFASDQTEAETPSQTNGIKLSKTASTTVSLDFVNFVKDRSAKAAAATYQGQIPGYATVGDHFHMLGKHLSLAGADKLVKAHCKRMLKAGTTPSVDTQAIDHAVSCVRTYAPSYNAKELMSNSALPSTPKEWAVHLKKLKKKGLVTYCHRAARQLNAMGSASQNQAAGSSIVGGNGLYRPAAYNPRDQTQAAHLTEICSLSQKEKFFACIGATIAVGLIVLGVIVAVCGATGVVACIGAAFPSATVGTAVFVAGFGLIAGAVLTACGAYLSSSSYHPGRRTAATFSTI